MSVAEKSRKDPVVALLGTSTQKKSRVSKGHLHIVFLAASCTARVFTDGSWMNSI